MTTIVMENSDILMRIITTHTQARQDAKALECRKLNLQQLYDKIKNINHFDSKPLIVTGDFNVIAEYPDSTPTEEYTQMKVTLEELGLVDVYRTKHRDLKSNPGFTYDGYNNRLLPILTPKDRGVRQRLDYIFINQTMADIMIEDSKVSHDYRYSSQRADDLMDLSDHYPLIGSFSFNSLVKPLEEELK